MYTVPEGELVASQSLKLENRHFKKVTIFYCQNVDISTTYGIVTRLTTGQL